MTTSTRFRVSLLAPRYWPTWIGLGLLRLLVLLPFGALVFLGRQMGRLLALLPIPFKAVATRNIELCLPELAPAERDALLRRHFRSLGLALFETAIAWWGSKERIRRIVTVEGLEHVDRALAQGRGVILLSAHFTTLELGARVIADRIPLDVMYRPTKNRLLSLFLTRNRARHTRRAIPRDDVRTLVTALRNNEVVWYAPDQSYRKKGAELVELFGIPAATNTATSRLARMTGAAVLPYFPERLPGDGRYRMVIHPRLEDFPSESPAADAERFNHLIEAQVRRLPEQYFWIHKRFKGLGPGYPSHYAPRA